MVLMERFASWSIDAVNLPEHADNPVHTLEGGLAIGCDGAVVAGTTVFAYLHARSRQRGDERGSWVVATRSGSGARAGRRAGRGGRWVRQGRGVGR